MHISSLLLTKNESCDGGEPVQGGKELPLTFFSLWASIHFPTNIWSGFKEFSGCLKKKKKKIHLAFIWEISAAALHFHHPRGPPKGKRQEWGLGEEEGVFLSPGFWQLWRAWGALLVAQNPYSWVRMPSGSCFPKNMITQKITQEIHILGLVSETCWCMHMKCRREPSSLSSLHFCQSGFSKHIL